MGGKVRRPKMSENDMFCALQDEHGYKMGTPKKGPALMIDKSTGKITAHIEVPLYVPKTTELGKALDRALKEMKK